MGTVAGTKPGTNAIALEKRIVGKKFKRLTVIKFLRMQARRPDTPEHRWSVYECLCDCGKTVEVCGTRVLSGNTKSCGCLMLENARLPTKYIGFPPGEGAFRAVYLVYTKNAKKRGLAFELTLEQARKLLTGDCYFCGQPPSMVYPPPSRWPLHNGSFTYSGIDRLINGQGYLPLNCVSCCWPCNQMKSSRDASAFLETLARILRNRREQDGDQNEIEHEPAHVIGDAC